MPTQSDDQGTVRYIRCPSCGTPNPATAPTCFRCGKAMQAAPVAAAPPPAAPAQRPAATLKVVCQKCGKPLPTGSKFCGFCGAPLPAAAPPATPPAVAPQRPLPPPAPPRISSSIPPVKVPPAQPTPPLRPVPTAPSPAIPQAPPRPAAPKAPPPAPPTPEGTVLFTGMRAPKIEVSLCEVKADGSLGQPVQVTQETTFGREGCNLNFPNDPLLSPRHASLAIREAKLFLKDLGSQNGTFLKQRQDTELRPGDVILLGRELFRFTTQSLDEAQGQAAIKGTWVIAGAPKLQRGPVTAKLEHIQLSGETIEEYNLDKPETTIGRSQADLVFKNDPYMSGKHARILTQPGRFILQDLQSTNGVYRRIKAEVELKEGDEFFLGEQRFRLSIKTS